MKVKGFLSALVAASVLSVGSALHAGTTGSVVLNSQARAITAGATAALNSPTGGGQPISQADTQTSSAPDFGSFTATVHAHAVAPVGNSQIVSDQTASQTSTVTTSGFTASGNATQQGQSDSFGEFDTAYTIGFSVLAPINYTLTASADTNEHLLNNYGFRISLRPEGGATIINDSPTPTLTNSSTLGALATVNRQGVLQPGNYIFDFKVSDSSDNGASSTYALNVAFSDVGGTSAVPLPAAFWPATITLVAAGWLAVRRNRLRRI
jgi:hypothetical protein